MPEECIRENIEFCNVRHLLRFRGLNLEGLKLRSSNSVLAELCHLGCALPNPVSGCLPWIDYSSATWHSAGNTTTNQFLLLMGPYVFLYSRGLRDFKENISCTHLSLRVHESILLVYVVKIQKSRIPKSRN